MSEQDGWNDIEVPEEDKIEIEIEQDEPQEVEEEQPVVEAKEEVKEEAPELEGIETKGAEKRIRQLIRQRKEREEEVEQLLETNKKLSETLKQKEEEVFNVSKNSLEASEKQLTDKIDLARQAYLEAFEEGDKERVLKAQEMLNDAQLDLKNVTSVKSRYSEEYSEPVQQEAPAPAPRRRDRRAEEWAGNNEWFGQDKVMTAAALAIDADLKEQGYDPEDEDFYDEVNNRIQEAFPHKFGEVQERVQENTNKPAQVVSGASRSSPNSGRKIKLSKEDVNLANKWGIPLEKYAAEKLKVNQADGEYTDIN
tara:strand:- start:694 stop:1620 length:927 start_codon:yes stop_codon:yes gene_type:complete